MAFPALGLAKIIWAVDVILDMKLPEFQDVAMPTIVPAPTPPPARWHHVMASTAVEDGQVQRTACDGFGLFIYREKKKISVFDSRCPHQSTDIPELALQGSTLTCPKHQWEFDAKSGDCIKKGDSPLKRIESKVVKGRLLAFW
jgi:nitrite reductase/ring-hydroxylating ferredoxin subunit